MGNVTRLDLHKIPVIQLYYTLKPAVVVISIRRGTLVISHFLVPPDTISNENAPLLSIQAPVKYSQRLTKI